jgi:uncharacterized protein (DUF779 family)
MLDQPHSCGAGSTPMSFPDREFLVGDVDLLLGIDGSPVTKSTTAVATESSDARSPA